MSSQAQLPQRSHFCVHCGMSLHEGANYCANCGTVANEAAKAPRQRDRLETVLKYFTILSAVVTAVAGFIAWQVKKDYDEKQLKLAQVQVVEKFAPLLQT